MEEKSIVSALGSVAAARFGTDELTVMTTKDWRELREFLSVLAETKKIAVPIPHYISISRSEKNGSRKNASSS